MYLCIHKPWVLRLTFLSLLCLVYQSYASEYTLRVAVLKLYLHNTELSAEDNLMLTDALRDGLRESNKLNVISNQHFNALIDPRIDRSASTDTTALQLGQASGADWVIMGKVTQMGRVKRVVLKVLEEPAGRVLAQHLIWAQDMEELAEQLQKAGNRLAVQSLFTLTKKADELELKTEKEKQKEEDKKNKKGEEDEDELTEAEKRMYTLSAVAQKQLDEIQKDLDETYRLRKENEKRKRLALEAEASSDWQKIEEQLGEGLVHTDVFDPEKPLKWSEVEKLVSNPSKISIHQQKKMLLAFIDHYKKVPKLQKRVKEAQNRYTWINRAEVQWTTVRGGRFLIGSAYPVPDEWPIQWISISTFQTSISEVTNAQYKQCVDAGACTPPHWDDAKCQVYQDKKLSFRKLPAAYRRGDLPVVCVDWQQANRFAKWAGGRLLSEAEWEYSARSGEKSYIYPWGTEEASCDRIVMSIDFKSGCGFNMPWPVCSKPTGSNSYGMCDLSGNVWEWVIDRYRPNHEKVPIDGSPVTGGGLKVIRGGGYASSFREARASTRGQLNPKRFTSYVGFRVAREYLE